MLFKSEEDFAQLDFPKLKRGNDIYSHFDVVFVED